VYQCYDYVFVFTAVVIFFRFRDRNVKVYYVMLTTLTGVHLVFQAAVENKLEKWSGLIP
jgi:hypothetical protein